MNERLSVLIADDEYWVRENLRTMLDWSAFDMELLEMASDGEEALARMEAAPANILITDIDMPFLSGVELMRQVRQRWPRTVIIVLSGYSDFEYVREALLVGAMDYLLKPVSKSRLTELLEKAAAQIYTRVQAEDERLCHQERLRLAASSLLDHDFSQWLHDAHRRELSEAAAAQMFEYERTFSNYRLVLIRLPELSQRLGMGGLPQSAAEAGHFIKDIITRAAPQGNRIVVHDLYHISRFLLISDMNLPLLTERMLSLIDDLRGKTDMRAKIVVSANYFSFSELRRAYDEVNEGMLACTCRNEELLAFAQTCRRSTTLRRLTDDIRSQMEYAVRQQNRERFDALLAQTGIFDRASQDWTMAELIQCVSDIAWLLRRQTRPDTDALQLLAMDNLLDSMLDCAERAALPELRSLFAQLADECFAPTEALSQSETMRDIVRHVKQYVDAHFAEEFTLNLLAERFNVTESYLSRMFKQYVGCNLMLYLAKARIGKAKALLVSGDVRITEVAQLVGYDDYSYFSRVFKKLEGVSPRQYREENLQ